MVEYRKPEQRSPWIDDRRLSSLQTTTARQRALDAQMKREIQAQFTAQLAKIRAMRLRGR